MFLHLSDFFRLGRAGFRLARHDALIPREYADRAPAGLRLLGACSRIFAGKDGKARAGQRLARALEGLGPAYIKLGQFLATRPDMVGREVAEDLRALQDRLTPFSEEDARAALVAEFGTRAEEIGALGPAIAAASVAQVHRATLAGGRDAAVKILRPGVERACARDLRAFARAAKVIEALFPQSRRLEPRKFIETVAQSVRIELDLRMEAAAADELAENMRGDKQFRVPKVYWEFCGRRVFAMEWIEATPITDHAALDAAGVDRQALAAHVMQSFLTQALHHGLFHADTHNGNLMVDADGRLAAVDFGIMGRLDEKTRRYFAEILFGFLNRDYVRVAEVHIEAGYIPAHHPVPLVAQALRSVGEPIVGQDARKLSMAKLLAQLFEITALFGMHMRPELVLLQKTMVTTEGVARELDPAHNLWASAEAVIEKWMTEKLGAQGQLKTAADGAVQMGRVLQNLPETLRKAEMAAAYVSEEGLRLDPDTIDSLAQAQAKRARVSQRALWAAIGAAAAAVLSQLL